MMLHDKNGEAIAEVYEDVAGQPTQELIKAVVNRNWEAFVAQLDASALTALHLHTVSKLGSICEAHNNEHLACPNCGNTGKEESLWIRGEVLLEYQDGSFVSARDAEDDLNFYAENTCYCPACDYDGVVYNFLPKRKEGEQYERQNDHRTNNRTAA